MASFLVTGRLSTMLLDVALGRQRIHDDNHQPVNLEEN